MSEDLQLAFKIDSADATAGVEAVNTALGKTKAVTATVNTAVGELSGALKDKLGPAGEAARAAFEKLSNTNGIRGLALSIVQAQTATDNFKNAVKAAQAEGVKMPASIGTAVKTMESDIAAATNKLGTVKNAMGDVAVQSRAMAEGWKQAASAGGSMGSMMNNLAEGTTGLGSSLAKVGLGLGGVAAAFKVGYTAGKEFSTWMKTFGVDVDVSAKSWSSFAGLLSKITSDPKHTKWLQDLSDSTKGYGDLLTPLEGKMNAQMKAHQSLGRQIQETDKELKALGLTWVTAGAATEKLEKQVTLVAERFAEAAKSGEPLNKTVLANAAAMKILDEALKEQGVALSTLTPQMQAAIFLHREQATAQESAANAAKATAAALKAEEQAQRDMARAIQEANSAFQAQAQTINSRNAAIDAATQKTKDFAAAQREGIVMEGHAEIIKLTAIKATQEQTAALVELLKQQNLYSDSLQKTLSIAEGWNDYLAVLVSSYKSGSTSLLAYKQALEMFQTQLLQTFGGATGKAKEALEDMIRTVQKLIDTAGAGGGPVDNSLTGGLNKTFNKP